MSSDPSLLSFHIHHLIAMYLDVFRAPFLRVHFQLRELYRSFHAEENKSLLDSAPGDSMMSSPEDR